MVYEYLIFHVIFAVSFVFFLFSAATPDVGVYMHGPHDDNDNKEESKYIGK